MKKQESEIKSNCRYCKLAGPVENFMCDCSILKIKRSTGVRKCDRFIVDMSKYNLTTKQHER